jgi:PAT family beta-lactamase induction signal transducer AmpG
MRSANLLDTRNGRLIAFGTLYISEGIPWGFASTAMVMFMRLEGLSIEMIGAFAAAMVLPWGFKWAWAPLIDIVKLDRFGGRRAWILFCITMAIITLVAMALIDFATHYRALVWVVIINNVFCATQDVAIDSLAVSTLREDERGTANGFMFGGQYLGIALGGGGAIYVSSYLGFNASIVFISALMAMNLLFVVLFIRDPFVRPVALDKATRQLALVLGTLRHFLRELYVGFLQSGRGPRLGVLFALLPIGTMALAYALLGTLQVDIGLEQNAIAQLSILNTVAGGFGCLVGGALGDRLGIKRTLGACYVLTALPTLYLALTINNLGLDAVSIREFYAVVVIHGFLFGGTFALHAAIFMGMTNPAVAATQFTGYMAMSNLVISYTNLWQGIVAERIGYAAALGMDAALILLPLAVLPLLRNRDEREERALREPVPAVD